MDELIHTIAPLKDLCRMHDATMTTLFSIRKLIVENKTDDFFLLFSENKSYEKATTDIVSAFFQLLFTGAGLWLQSISFTN